jgi:hypothetical protein
VAVALSVYVVRSQTEVMEILFSWTTCLFINVHLSSGMSQKKMWNRTKGLSLYSGQHGRHSNDAEMYLMPVRPTQLVAETELNADTL